MKFDFYSGLEKVTSVTAPVVNSFNTHLSPIAESLATQRGIGATAIIAVSYSFVQNALETRKHKRMVRQGSKSQIG